MTDQGDEPMRKPLNPAANLQAAMAMYLPERLKGGTPVDAPNRSHRGISAVFQVASHEGQAPCHMKVQLNYYTRHAFPRLQNLTVAAEKHALELAAGKGLRVPAVAWFATCKSPWGHFGALATETLNGRSLEAVLEDHTLDSGLLRAHLQETGVALADLHNRGLRHGACYPKHVIFTKTVPAGKATGQHVAWIDLESAGTARTTRAAAADLHRLVRATNRLKTDQGAVIADAYLQATQMPDRVKTRLIFSLHSND